MYIQIARRMQIPSEYTLLGFTSFYILPHVLCHYPTPHSSLSVYVCKALPLKCVYPKSQDIFIFTTTL